MRVASQNQKLIARFSEERWFSNAMTFIKRIGIKQGNRVVNVGTGHNPALGVATLGIGGHYIGYDLRQESHLTISNIYSRVQSAIKECEGNLAQVLGEFSSGPKSSSSLLEPKSQDFILILTGALSDPNSESNSEEVLLEALRVVKPGGRLLVGSFSACWQSDWGGGTEEEVAKTLMARVVRKKELKDKVQIDFIERFDYDVHSGNMYEVKSLG